MPVTDLVVQRGNLMSYRIFDVANEIALDKAEVKLGPTARRRASLGREGEPEVMVFTARPLEMALGTRTFKLPITGLSLDATVAARIFEYGAISILFDVPIPVGSSLASLTPLCDEIYDAPLLESLARVEIEALLARLGDAAEVPKPWHDAETYTVIHVVEHAPGLALDDLRDSESVAKLLLGETATTPLSDEQRKDVLETQLAYFQNDLTIIDWNSALVVDPAGRQVAEILEFAASQLLELRYYDSILDVELQRIYDDVARVRRRLLRTNYGGLARMVLRRLVELWEFTERVDNALKVIGDFYHSRVYHAAVMRFRIPEWQKSLAEKQALVRQAYDLLKGDVDIQRSQWLEIVIIALIAFEILSTFFH